MKEIFEEFSAIIENYQIIHERNDSKISELKGRIIFKNNSILEFTEILVHDRNKRKYSFQWMDKAFELKIRWDNAKHYPDLPNSPHHKHIGNEVFSSKEVKLLDVLEEISKS